MSMASIKIVCTTCGIEFEHRKKCYNRSDATQYENWAIDHIDTCPACWAKAKKEAEMEQAKKAVSESTHALPTITGVSEKQIAYAEKVRTLWFSRNKEFCKVIWNALDKELTPDFPIEGLRAELNLPAEMPAEEIFEQGRKAFLERLKGKLGYKNAFICITETNAHTIIDALR